VASSSTPEGQQPKMRDYQRWSGEPEAERGTHCKMSEVQFNTKRAVLNGLVQLLKPNIVQLNFVDFKSISNASTNHSAQKGN